MIRNQIFVVMCIEHQKLKQSALFLTRLVLFLVFATRLELEAVPYKAIRRDWGTKMGVSNKSLFHETKS